MSITTLFPNTHQDSVLTVVHPDYQKHANVWQKQRDVVAGSDVVKAAGKTYLQGFHASNDDIKGYEDYLARAVFVPFASKLINGMIGAVYRKPAKVSSNLSKKILDYDNVSPRHRDFQEFIKHISREMFTLGRCGVLVDYRHDKKRAMAHPFSAENILSWEEDIYGKLTYVLLREHTQRVQKPGDKKLNADAVQALASNTYLEYRLDEKTGLCGATRYDNGMQVIKRTNISARGRQLDYIPFVFFSPTNNNAEIQKSPISDVVDMNLAHYSNYGLLQLGRKHTAFPIFVVPVEATSTDVASYTINPSVVWEVPIGSKPSILEYYGDGLNQLSQSLSQIESQIVQISARLVGLRDLTSKYEDKEIFKILYAAEISTLIDMTKSITNGVSRVLEMYAEISGVPGKIENWDINVDIATEFRVSNIEARELRAVELLHSSGLLPLEATFRVLQENDFIASDTTFENYRALVVDEKAERRQNMLEEIEAKKKNSPDNNDTPDGNNDTPDGNNDTPDGNNDTPDGNNDNKDTPDGNADDTLGNKTKTRAKSRRAVRRKERTTNDN